MGIIIYAMVYLGSALMVYNIYGFVRFERYVRSLKGWDTNSGILRVPIVLLSFFLVGYLVVGLFGNPDLMMAGILFFGSVFVLIMYRLLSKITRRTVEAERYEAQLKAAKENDRAKSSFLASVSHEMRTPMNVIIGLDTLALKNPDLDAKTRKYLEKIGLSAQYLLGLINNILDIQRIENGTYEYKCEEYALQDVISQVSAITQTLCDEKGLAYEELVDKNSLASYMGDVTQVKELLLSILNNAVKYTDAPGVVAFAVEGPADVSKDETTRTITFRIRDTGVGMDEEFLPKIFDVFTQEDASSTSRFGGGGLSLALTKKSIDRMGGTIEVESKKGEGSLFIVALPLVLAEQHEPMSEEPEQQDSLEGKCVLIVEDVEENAEIVTDLLELEGVECERAENGRVAVDKFTHSEPHHYDIVLMDLRMPEMDGLEATRSIRQSSHPDAQTIPIVALTANAFQSDVDQSLDAGMNAHMAKPVDADALYETIREYTRAMPS